MLGKEPSFHIKKEKVPNLNEIYSEKLKIFWKKVGKPLKFFDIGSIEELNKKIQIKTNILDGLSEQKIQDITECVEKLCSYVYGPVFTDKIMYHDERRCLEKDLEKDIEIGMSSEYGKLIVDYYNLNKIGYNNCYSIYDALKSLVNTLEDKDIKQEINNLLYEIPIEFTEKKLIEFDKGHFVKLAMYYELNSEEKVKKVSIVSEIAKKTLDILTG